jgi:hypothetical protein
MEKHFTSCSDWGKMVEQIALNQYILCCDDKDIGYFPSQHQLLVREKAVIWCFAASEFTETDGWRILPIEP